MVKLDWIIPSAFSVVSLIKNMFDISDKLGPKSDANKEKGERVYHIVSKVQISLANTIDHISENKHIIEFFLNLVPEENDEKIGKEKIIKITSVYPIPNIIELQEDDLYALTLNYASKMNRDLINKTNEYLKCIKDDNYDENTLSYLVLNFLFLEPETLIREYENIVRLKLERSYSLSNVKINESELDEMVSSDVDNMRKRSISLAKYSANYEKSHLHYKKIIKKKMTSD